VRVSERVDDITLDIDLHHDLLTTRQAADLAFGPTDDPDQALRNTTRINVWRHRKHLQPVTDQQGNLVPNADGVTPVYLGVEVLRCVAKMAKRDPRRPGHKRARKHDEPGHRGGPDTA
jgi:hypothetical protein